MAFRFFFTHIYCHLIFFLELKLLRVENAGRFPGTRPVHDFVADFLRNEHLWNFKISLHWCSRLSFVDDPPYWLLINHNVIAVLSWELYNYFGPLGNVRYQASLQRELQKIECALFECTDSLSEIRGKRSDILTELIGDGIESGLIFIAQRETQHDF